MRLRISIVLLLLLGGLAPVRAEERPLADWMRGPLQARLRASLASPVLAGCDMFNLDYIQQLLQQHQSGRRDHSAPLWSLMMFESFLRQLLQAPGQRAERQAA